MGGQIIKLNHRKLGFFLAVLCVITLTAFHYHAPLRIFFLEQIRPKLVFARDAMHPGKLQFDGIAKTFYPGINPAFYSAAATENSLVNFNGGTYAFYDPHSNGSLYVARINALGLSTNPVKVMNDVRFPYTLRVGKLLYTFGWHDRDIYLWQSGDGHHWQPANAGKPVMTHSDDPHSIYFQLWNVGVAVDDRGLWHLLIECGPRVVDLNHVGLASSTARMTGGRLDFDAKRTAGYVIPHAGSPDLKFIPGKGLLAIHGVLGRPRGAFGNEWYISASTLPTGATHWTTHLDRFRIGTPGVHVCDPSIAEVHETGRLADFLVSHRIRGRLMLTMSYHQDHIYAAYANMTLAQLFDVLTQK